VESPVHSSYTIEDNEGKTRALQKGTKKASKVKEAPFAAGQVGKKSHEQVVKTQMSGKSLS